MQTFLDLHVSIFSIVVIVGPALVQNSFISSLSSVLHVHTYKNHGGREQKYVHIRTLVFGCNLPS